MEIDRAAKAAQSYAVGEWIKSVRTSVADSYTQGQTGEDLRKQLTDEYYQNDEGGRGGYIAGSQNELSAMRTVAAPKAEAIEAALYTVDQPKLQRRLHGRKRNHQYEL